MNAAGYRPSHGGYPDAPRPRARRTRGLPVVVVNTVQAPPAPGFPRSAIEEAYEFGRRDGRR